jgi:DNA-binding NarL/FixJ family response regulator
VETSQDGQEAVEKYKESLSTEKFHAVILDLTIPGGVGGAEAARQILEIDKDAKIFISSGYSNDPIMSDYKSYGFTGIIPKPYKMSDIHAILSRDLDH